MNRQIHIIGGGTVFHIRPHFGLCATAYGTTAWDITAEVMLQEFQGEVHTYTTRMAGDEYEAHAVGKKGKITHLNNADEKGLRLETNEDVAKLLDRLVLDPEPKIIFMPVAVLDFKVDYLRYEGEGIDTRVGKQAPRLKTGQGKLELVISDAEKIIRRVRKERKDIFLVGFKSTTDNTPQDMFNAGLKLLKTASCNLVLVNDLHTKLNMIVTPEQAPYEPTKDRKVAVAALVKMALSRAQGHFTRSSVVPNSHPIPWSSDEIPATLKTVVEHCIKRGAYKPFLGKTVGHFAARIPTTIPDAGGLFLTSLRGTDFNKIRESGLAKVMVIDDTRVSALGGKPSVGGQSQRIIFKNHPEMDCIVHFHCPLRPEYRDNFPTRPQALHECGSHECGQNTSDGLVPFTAYEEEAAKHRVKAVMLDKHGPNIVFNRDIDPRVVIDFIERHFDLERSTSEVPL